MNRPTERRTVILYGLVAVLFASFLVAAFSLRASRSAKAASVLGVDRTNRVRSGTELAAVYVTSSTCGASRDPTLKESLQVIRQHLGARAFGEGKRFVWIGVALDRTPEGGIQFLKPYGPFDEILAGGSWLNTGSISFLIRGELGDLSTPQLIVFERDVVSGETLRVSPDRLILSLRGGERIHSFASDPSSEMEAFASTVKGQR